MRETERRTRTTRRHCRPHDTKHNRYAGRHTQHNARCNNGDGAEGKTRGTRRGDYGRGGAAAQTMRNQRRLLRIYDVVFLMITTGRATDLPVEENRWTWTTRYTKHPVDEICSLFCLAAKLDFWFDARRSEANTNSPHICSVWWFSFWLHFVVRSFVSFARFVIFMNRIINARMVIYIYIWPLTNIYIHFLQLLLHTKTVTKMRMTSPYKMSIQPTFFK